MPSGTALLAASSCRRAGAVRRGAARRTAQLGSWAAGQRRRQARAPAGDGQAAGSGEPAGPCPGQLQAALTASQRQPPAKQRSGSSGRQPAGQQELWALTSTAPAPRPRRGRRAPSGGLQHRAARGARLPRAPGSANSQAGEQGPHSPALTHPAGLPAPRPLACTGYVLHYTAASAGQRCSRKMCPPELRPYCSLVCTAGAPSLPTKALNLGRNCTTQCTRRGASSVRIGLRVSAGSTHTLHTKGVLRRKRAADACLITVVERPRRSGGAVKRSTEATRHVKAPQALPRSPRPTQRSGGRPGERGARAAPLHRRCRRAPTASWCGPDSSSPRCRVAPCR